MQGRVGFMNAISATYLGTKGNDFQNTLHEEECCEHDIQVLQDFIICYGSLMVLETYSTKNLDPDGCTDITDGIGEKGEACTFIIRTTVLSAMRAMILYSNGGDTTNCHIRY